MVKKLHVGLLLVSVVAGSLSAMQPSDGVSVMRQGDSIIAALSSHQSPFQCLTTRVIKNLRDNSQEVDAVLNIDRSMQSAPTYLSPIEMRYPGLKDQTTIAQLQAAIAAFEREQNKQ